MKIRIFFVGNHHSKSAQMHIFFSGKVGAEAEAGVGQKNSALAGGGVARALEPLEGGKGLIDIFIH